MLTWRAGEGGGLILPALAKSAPTLPSPPRHPGTARCAACGYAGRGCQWLFLRLPVWACGDSPLEAGGRATTSARSRRSPATRFQRQRVKKPFKTQAHTGSHGQGVSRSDNLCSQRAEDGSPLVRAQSEATSAQPSRAQQRQPESAERGSVTPTRQREVTPPRQVANRGDPKHRHHRGQNGHCWRCVSAPATAAHQK